MPTILRPHNRAMPPALVEVNRRIQLLMDQSADKRRAEDYARLLGLWAEATAARTNWVKAA